MAEKATRSSSQRKKSSRRDGYKGDVILIRTSLHSASFPISHQPTICLLPPSPMTCAAPPLIELSEQPTRFGTRATHLETGLTALGVAIFAALGGILFGYDSGVISGILEMVPFNQQYGPYFADNIPTNLITVDNPARRVCAPDGDRSLVVSILSVGTFVGALASASMADRLGRRRGLQLAIVIFYGGGGVAVQSRAVPLFAVGRVIAGLGVGAISVTVPLYQSEVSPAWIRGALVTGYQWMITVGLLMASIVNKQHATSSRSWRLPDPHRVAVPLCHRDLCRPLFPARIRRGGM